MFNCFNIMIRKYFTSCTKDNYFPNNDDVKWLSLDGQKLLCKVIDVYDGDTLTIVFPFCNTFFKEKCRLEGIDSAEIRTKNIEEKKYAIETKKWLSNLILNKFVYIQCGNWDKYGRLLGTIFLIENPNKSINNMLIENNMAYQYDGKTKKCFTEWK